MAITTEQKDLLNNRFGKLPNKVQLGTLIENAEEGGLAAGSVDTDELAADAVTGAKIEDDAVSLEHLDAGITPSHLIKFGAQYTTTGGAAAEAITVTGAAAADMAFVRLVNDGTNNVTISSWAMTTNTLTVTFSGDPGADTIIDYIVIQAAA